MRSTSRTARVHGATLVGAEAELVVVEARFEPEDSKRTDVVFSGLPDAVIREGRGRLLAALTTVSVLNSAPCFSRNSRPRMTRSKVGRCFLSTL